MDNDNSENTGFDMGRVLAAVFFVVALVILARYARIIDWRSTLAPMLLGLSLLISLGLNIIALIKLRYAMLSEAVRLGWVLLILLFPLAGAISLLIVKPGSEPPSRNL